MRTAGPTSQTGAEAGRDGQVNPQDPPTGSQRQRASRQGQGEAVPSLLWEVARASVRVGPAQGLSPGLHSGGERTAFYLFLVPC